MAVQDSAPLQKFNRWKAYFLKQSLLYNWYSMPLPLRAMAIIFCRIGTAVHPQIKCGKCTAKLIVAQVIEKDLVDYKTAGATLGIMMKELADPLTTLDARCWSCSPQPFVSCGGRRCTAEAPLRPVVPVESGFAWGKRRNMQQGVTGFKKDRDFLADAHELLEKQSRGKLHSKRCFLVSAGMPPFSLFGFFNLILLLGCSPHQCVLLGHCNITDHPASIVPHCFPVIFTSQDVQRHARKQERL